MQLLLINGKTFYRARPNCRKNGNTAEPPFVSCRFAVFRGFHTRQKKRCSFAVLQFLLITGKNLLPQPAEMPQKRQYCRTSCRILPFCSIYWPSYSSKKVAVLLFLLIKCKTFYRALPNCPKKRKCCRTFCLISCCLAVFMRLHTLQKNVAVSQSCRFY